MKAGCVREADVMRIAQCFSAGSGNVIGHSPRSGRLKNMTSPDQPSASRTRDVNVTVTQRWSAGLFSTVRFADEKVRKLLGARLFV